MRWTGVWATPNCAAAVLAVGITLLCGIGAAGHQQLRNWPRCRLVFDIAMAILLIWGTYLLIQTYSRGGWVALCAGLATLTVGLRSRRWYPLTCAAIVIVLVVVWPAGLDRAASSVSFVEDKSIYHRLLLWQGALQMMYEHPWKGVGAGRFGEMFMDDYQLPTHVETYSTAVNDFLTFGTERGIPALAVIVGALLAAAALGLRLGKTRDDAFLAACAGGLAASLIASGFSSVITQPSDAFITLFCALAIPAKAAFLLSRRRNDTLWRAALSGGTLMVGLIIAAAGVCVAAGSMAAYTRPVISTVSDRTAELNRIEARPSRGPVKGTLVYIPDCGEEPADLVQSTLRPLARKGWEVISFKPAAYPSDASWQTVEFLAELQHEGRLQNLWIIAGHRRGAQAALFAALAACPSAVACYLTPQRSAFAEYSFESLLAKNHLPLLLCAQSADRTNSAQRVLSLTRQPNAGSPVAAAVQIHPGNFYYLSKSWQAWIDAIDHFADQQQAGPSR